MRDRLWIYAGLAVFVALLTAPFWLAHTGANSAAQIPDLVLPTGQKDCVAPAATMRATHMQLLVGWREDVVRRGSRQYVAYDGKVYEKSLTGTCLGCHNKAEFCDRCHAYAGVSSPYCWSCHNQPQSIVARSAP
jgi:hypothetical protein